MNWHTSKFMIACGAYYYNRRPAGADFDEVRLLWARGNAFNQALKVPPVEEQTPERGAMFAALQPPGGERVVQMPTSGGLFFSIEGEMLPDFPVDRYVRAIAESTGPITVRLNCPGGNLMAGFALHDALLKAGPERVEVLVAGICGSAGTLPLCAAGTRRVLEGSRFLIHGPSDVVMGNAIEMRAAADMLDSFVPRMAAAYKRICPPALVDAWLSGGDHIMSPNEARAVGMATEVLQPEVIPLPDT